VVVAANKTDVGDRNRAVKEVEGRAWVGTREGCHSSEGCHAGGRLATSSHHTLFLVIFVALVSPRTPVDDSRYI
jgi:hypothetical protein